MATHAHNASARAMVATWYDLPGSPMANGKPFNSKDPTLAASSKKLYGKTLRITNPQNGRYIIVSVGDRMPPQHPGNRIDLSPAGATQLGFLSQGKLTVQVEELHNH